VFDGASAMISVVRSSHRFTQPNRARASRVLSVLDNAFAQVGMPSALRKSARRTLNVPPGAAMDRNLGEALDWVHQTMTGHEVECSVEAQGVELSDLVWLQDQIQKRALFARRLPSSRTDSWPAHIRHLIHERATGHGLTTVPGRVATCHAHESMALGWRKKVALLPGELPRREMFSRAASVAEVLARTAMAEPDAARAPGALIFA
jgi:hypothetical protein